MKNTARRALGITAATFSLFAMAVGLSGCPVAADLESGPERFPALDGATSTGGGGPTGGNGNGGSTAGGGGMVESCDRPFPTLDCDWRAALGASNPSLSGYCFKGGCHNTTTKAGGLDLTTRLPNGQDDLGFIARLLNRPAAYKSTCGAGVPCVPTAMTCDECAQCVPGKVLVSTDAPGTGFVFDKILPFVPGTTTNTMDLGCGKAMPTFNTTGTPFYTQAHKDCLIKFFTEIAKTPGTWPCGQGAGGSGAGGTGGSAGAAAAGGGAGGMSAAGASGI